MQITENYRIIDGSQRVGIRRPEEGVFTGHPGQGGAGCTGIITQEFKAFPYQYFMLSPHKMLTAYTEKHKKRRNSPQFEGSFEHLLKNIQIEAQVHKPVRIHGF